MLVRICTVIGLAVFSSMALAESKLKTQADKLSYTLGVQVAEQYKSNGIEINTKIFSEAVEEVLKGKTPRLSRDEMIQSIQMLQKEQVNRMKSVGEGNLKKGQKFLASNKSKKGVIGLPSGVQYKIEKKGSGKRPTLDNSVIAHYRGTLIDGTEFDSSYTRGQPATFPVSGVIKGWQEVLQLMQIGAKWKVFIPPALAYGERGAGPSIGPNETLIFDIELIDIK